MNHLSIKNISKTYNTGLKVINNISLDIKNGVFGLLGPNGAGKSSLMKTIVGLQHADSGTITFNGADVSANPNEIKKHLGFLPQDFGVYPKTSAYDLLNHMAILKGVTNANERKEQVLALLEKVNLFQQRKKEVYTFSGGMRQRFGVAQALLGNPKIVIVDEPTAGLDPEERNRFNNLLSEIGTEIIIILSTHLVEDVHNLCANMAVMHKGSILVQGNPADLIHKLNNRIWQKQINKTELAYYQNETNVISSQFTAGKLNIRVLTDNPPFNFQSVPPMLEDVYFATLNPVNT
ncbi:ABC transporter ATP-binding protein [Pedobacter rhodius]|uniref:ABC transporter ATP-binding protein n=1 Tax=Pedobacter rhodius TaxID=3004098 RepID=A0ABT4KWP7_9SPHI|nr:ABC transporter ATP-binding protein [Pedobacter sp. SJ11]MCZ4223350.1 ABC transporter ATP-binding protein [Pedobacter sp. SJ11]